MRNPSTPGINATPRTLAVPRCKPIPRTLTSTLNEVTSYRFPSAAVQGAAAEGNRHEIPIPELSPGIRHHLPGRNPVETTHRRILGGTPTQNPFDRGHSFSGASARSLLLEGGRYYSAASFLYQIVCGRGSTPPIRRHRLPALAMLIAECRAAASARAGNQARPDYRGQ